MKELYEQAIVGIKAHRKVKLKTLPSGRIAILSQNRQSCKCVLHKRTEDECARILFERGILAALGMSPDIAISAEINDKCVPAYLMESLHEHLVDTERTYRLTMRAHPLITVGVPHTVAESFAKHIEDDHAAVVSFFNEIGDPVMVDA